MKPEARPCTDCGTWRALIWASGQPGCMLCAATLELGRMSDIPKPEDAMGIVLTTARQRAEAQALDWERAARNAGPEAQALALAFARAYRNLAETIAAAAGTNPAPRA